MSNDLPLTSGLAANMADLVANFLEALGTPQPVIDLQKKNLEGLTRLSDLNASAFAPLFANKTLGAVIKSSADGSKRPVFSISSMALPDGDGSEGSAPDSIVGLGIDIAVADGRLGDQPTTVLRLFAVNDSTQQASGFACTATTADAKLCYSEPEIEGQYLDLIKDVIRAGFAALPAGSNPGVDAVCADVFAELDGSASSQADMPFSDGLLVRMPKIIGILEKIYDLSDGEILDPYIDFVADLAARGESLTLRLLQENIFHDEVYDDMIFLSEAKNGEIVIGGFRIPLVDDEGEVLDSLEIGFDADGNCILRLKGGGFSIVSAGDEGDNTFSPQDVKSALVASEVLSEKQAQANREVVTTALKNIRPYVKGRSNDIRQQTLFFLASL